MKTKLVFALILLAAVGACAPRGKALTPAATIQPSNEPTTQPPNSQVTAIRAKVDPTPTATRQAPTSPAQSVLTAVLRAPAIAGWLHTRGTQILDAQNRPIHLLGVDDGTMAGGVGFCATDPRNPDVCHRGWHAPDIAEADAIAAWGFN